MVFVGNVGVRRRVLEKMDEVVERPEDLEAKGGYDGLAVHDMD